MRSKKKAEKNILEYKNINSLVPGKSIGVFVLGSSIKDYDSRADCEHVIFDLIEDGGDWYNFLGGSISVWLDNGIIDAISCCNDLYIDGVNIIGMNINKFIKRFNVEVDTCELDYQYLEPLNRHRQYCWYFKEYPEMSLWTWRNSIINIMISR